MDIAGEVRFADYVGRQGPSVGLEPYFHRGVHFFCRRHLWRAKIVRFLSSKWALPLIGPHPMSALVKTWRNRRAPSEDFDGGSREGIRQRNRHKMIAVGRRSIEADGAAGLDSYEIPATAGVFGAFSYYFTSPEQFLVTAVVDVMVDPTSMDDEARDFAFSVAVSIVRAVRLAHDAPRLARTVIDTDQPVLLLTNAFTVGVGTDIVRGCESGRFTPSGPNFVAMTYLRTLAVRTDALTRGILDNEESGAEETLAATAMAELGLEAQEATSVALAAVTHVRRQRPA
jgi:hypothetical protein